MSAAPRPAVTRESVRTLAVEQAADPATVREVVHPAFNEDSVSGGFAFLRDEVLLICGVGGGRTWTVDPGTDDARRGAIDGFWRVAQRHSLRKRGVVGGPADLERHRVPDALTEVLDDLRGDR